MGNLIAERFAMDHPHRVHAFVLIGAFATLKGNAAEEELWQTGVVTMTYPVHEPVRSRSERPT
jgi:hypothetical protein